MTAERHRMFRGEERFRAENEKLAAKAIQRAMPHMTWGAALRAAISILPPLGVARSPR